MDRERQRIEEDLRGLIAGEVRCDTVFRQLYASDASLFTMEPLGVVRPRSTEDVVAVVQYAASQGIPIHPRGAGSGLAGGAVGPGLVLDFSRSMRRVLQTNEATVRVQPGVVLDNLNQCLARQGRRFGPDPATRKVRTLGGIVSVDASGSHWLRSGSARRHVESMEVVLADGQVMEFGVHPLEPRTGGERSTRQTEIIRSLTHLIERRADQIVKHRPRSCVNASGYDLHNFIQGEQVHLAKLLVGSEGTLAIVTQLTLSTEPIAKARCCVLFLFDRLEKAAQAARIMMPLSPMACDLMDRRHLNLARESDVRLELMIPGAAEAVLLVEFEGENAREVDDKAKEAVDHIDRGTGMAAGAQIAREPADIALCWRLARDFAPTLYRMKGESRPVPFVEDIAVPPDAMTDMLASAQGALKRHEITASLFAHAGHGQLHVRPLIDMTDANDRRRLIALADDLYEHTWRLGGAISGEQGDGLSRTPYLARQYGPLCDVFRAVKHIFDPDNLLNPGKIVPTSPIETADSFNGVIYPVLPGSVQGDLNIQETRSLRDTDASSQPLDPQLDWQSGGIESAINVCNRCGVCRTESESTRMCPIFRIAPSEEASPRAKANLLRSVLAGRISRDEVLGDPFKQVVDLCVHCHMCRLECPAQVNIPALMVEAKAAHVRDNGMAMSERMFAHIDSLCAVGKRFRPLANWSIQNRMVRWIAEKMLGLSQNRRLPRFERRSFLQQAARRKLTRLPRGGGRGEQVAYFVDTYANYFDVSLAESLVAVLEHNHIPVFVPPKQRYSAMALIAHGAIESAQSVARQNIALLAEAVRQGCTIVATEPSAALALSHEYLALLPEDEDALLVAHATREACHYLWKLHQQGDLRLDFKPLALSVGYHVPCHVKALEIGTPTENLFGLVQGIRVEMLEKGCSGMAGTFGLSKRNYRTSLRAGLPLINALRDAPIDVGMTECCTCKMQMEHGMAMPTTHPVKLLAFAYGLMPELGDELAADRSIRRTKRRPR